MKVTSLEISNFRSLKSISIPDFSDTTILYGENNAGKSNIISALNLIFWRKPDVFYRGMVTNARNNFYNNDISKPISFKVAVEVNKSELQIDDKISSIFGSKKKFVFTFEGSIAQQQQSETNIAEIKSYQISVDKTIIYKANENGFDYFPKSAKSISLPERESAFIKLIDVFNNCVYVVNSDRDMLETDMTIEHVEHLTPHKFKKFLYNLYLSPSNFHLFEKIDSVFNNEPFSFGNISFSTDEDGRLEIMIKNGSFRLPIKNLGSAVLQILYTITAIISNKSKIVCIEELEQNLSPKKQFQALKKIQSMLSDPDLNVSQLIITSHSSVYSKPKLGTIYFLKKDSCETKVVDLKVEATKKKILANHFAPLAEPFIPMSDEEFSQFRKDIEAQHDLK